MNQIIILLAFAATPDFTARVVGISDGDTLTVLKSDRTQVKIRLHGVDSPETGQDFGSRAKQEASSLAFDKTVTVRVRDTGLYGRTVAEVILPDGQSLNRAMVWRGYAWWYRSYAPDDRDLAKLESTAKIAKRGLWSGADPVLPWAWWKGEQEYFDLLLGALTSRDPRLDLLAAAVGLIDDLPRTQAIDLLRRRAQTMDEWRASIAVALPPDADLGTWGPVGEVIGLWLHTAESRSEWTRRLIRRLEEGAFRMAGEKGSE